MPKNLLKSLISIWVISVNKLFSLDDRLSACAGFVRNRAKIADIGTDHAYLPVWLAKQGKIMSAVAADIRPMPLERGEENIKKYGCENIVSTRLSDGLNEISPDECDDIIIAGMGGELIVSILSKASWVKDAGKRLILQPMTRAHILREYLSQNGFEIIAEKPCRHGGKIYTVILSEYTGRTISVSPSFYYIGKLMPSDELARAYTKQILKKLTYKAEGKKHSGEDSTELDAIINEIKTQFGGEI